MTEDEPMVCPRGLHACECDAGWWVCLPCGIRWRIGRTGPPISRSAPDERPV